MTRKRSVIVGVVIVVLAGGIFFVVNAMNKPTGGLNVITHDTSPSKSGQQSKQVQNKSRTVPQDND